MVHHLLVAVANAQPGRDEEFNSWYETVHMPEVLALSGFVAARRYETAEDKPDVPRYMAVYEIEGDADEAMGGLFKTMQDGGFTMSDSLDTGSASMTLYRARTPKILR
jgi:hypothetical protein